jgi:hypothetical protein
MRQMLCVRRNFMPEEVTRQQMAKVIVKYGADHPNLLWIGGALFTAATLKDAYPCKE